MKTRWKIWPLAWVLLPLSALLGQLEGLFEAFCILLAHEGAHLLAAKALGIKAEEIQLMPFGGMARFASDLAFRPGAEALVAMAGPFANLFLLLGGFAVWSLWPWLPLQSFLVGNALMLTVNLLPAFPLDGGRVLRASLSRRLGLTKATRLTAALGMAAGLLLALGGILAALWGPILLTASLAGAAVFWFAKQERSSAAGYYLREFGHRQTVLEKEALPMRRLAARGSLPLGMLKNALRAGEFSEVVLLNEQYREIGVLEEMDIRNGFLGRMENRPLQELLSTGSNRHWSDAGEEFLSPLSQSPRTGEKANT